MTCVANPHCAYIRKASNRSLIDWLPYISDNNICVLRESFPSGLAKLTATGTKALNHLFDKVVNAITE